MSSSLPAPRPSKNLRATIAASSAGNLLAWYDAYLFLSLSPVIAPRFFPDSNPLAALLSTLAIFIAGLLVRPLGALIFGRLGDINGRKDTFSLTILLAAASTFAIGIVPGYDSIGFAAPVTLLLLRLLQGLAIGGESGGAITYVAEHSPAHRKGYFTAWTQATTSLGLAASLGTILLTRNALDPDHSASIEKFNAWGWRLPFLASILPLFIALYIRSKLEESPLYAQLRQEGKLSPRPLKESFADKANLKKILLALLGITMGQGVIAYTSQLYVRSFLENTCHIDFDQSASMLMIAIALATPLFLLFGNWSDRIGRKWIMLSGMLLAVLLYALLFGQLLAISGTKGRTELADQKEIRSTVAFIGKSRDLARTTSTFTHYVDGMQVVETKQDTVFADGRISARPKTSMSGTLNTVDYWKITALLFTMILPVTMVGGPIGAFLVDLFPTRIRYSSISLPYEIGNGIFGGLTSSIALLATANDAGNKLAGVWYPIGTAAVCFVIGALFISNSHRTFAHVN